MSVQKLEPVRLRWSSMPIGIAVGLILAALLPPIIMLAFTYLQTRPALTNQVTTAMQTDAKTRTQLIDNYLQERLGDAQTLVQIQVVPVFISDTPDSPTYKGNTLIANYALAAGKLKDTNYVSWSLFDKSGNLRLSYPVAPTAHGQYIVPPQDLQTVIGGKAFISPVYYTPNTGKASVDLYAPINVPQAPGSTQPPTILGFARATLNLDYIWNEIVQADKGSNGTGSYAEVVDENGVRIADTDPKLRFTSVAPLSSTVQQEINNEARYGNTNNVPLVADPDVETSLQTTDDSNAFQDGQPANQTQAYQVARQRVVSKQISWNYFVFSPINTVTAVANNEFFYTVIIVITDALIVLILGLIAWRRLAHPIMEAVSYLRRNSNDLSKLAAIQQKASSEQTLIVDSSQTGLQSIQYYTDALKAAVHQLREASLDLARNWRTHEPQKIDAAIEQILSATRYLENAAEYQHTSNQRLAMALNVATLATDQLLTGATSAAEAAKQMEGVVKTLLAIIGKTKYED